MGYTPLFDTLTKGTLCGRWPDIGLWPVVLSLADRHGVVDCTPAYIAGVTGLPLDDVVACMKRFCQPDAYSRSQEHQGARLELIDAHREWGWQVVNHGKYREKARKAMQQLDATASGRDADRKRIEREKSTGGVQPRPAMSGADRPSDSDSDSDSDGREDVERASAPTDDRKSSSKGTRVPEPFEVTTDLRQWFAAKCPHVILDEATEEFVRYWKAVPGAKGRKLDWPATWQNRMTENEARAIRFAPKKSRDLTWHPTE